MKLNKIIVGCLLFIKHFSFSQELNVISNGGNENTTAAGSITWTIGEVSINTIESPNTHATQGFNQGWLQFLNVESFSEKITVNVYPNPTTHFINIESSKNSTLMIVDFKGNLVFTKKIKKQEKIDLSQLSKGVYFLNFKRKNSKIQNIKIVIQ